MATGVQTLTLEEFRRRYAGRKPYYEYWFGEAVQKTAGTWLHSVLQAIAADGPGVSDQDLGNLEIPALIIGHDIDYIHPLSYAAALSQLIPHSRFVTVTPKALSKATYLEDLHVAVTNFLEIFL